MLLHELPNPWTPSLCSIPNCTITSAFVGPNIFHITLLSNVCNLCSSLKIRDVMFHIHTKQMVQLFYISYKYWSLVHSEVNMMITLTVFELRAYRLPQNDLFLISSYTSTLVNIIFSDKKTRRRKILNVYCIMTLFLVLLLCHVHTFSCRHNIIHT